MTLGGGHCIAGCWAEGSMHKAGEAGGRLGSEWKEKNEHPSCPEKPCSTKRGERERRGTVNSLKIKGKEGQIKN